MKAEWRYTEDGERVRVSVRTGRVIPIPKLAEETPDYKTKVTYKEQDKDTVADDVTRYCNPDQLTLLIEYSRVAASQVLGIILRSMLKV